MIPPTPAFTRCPNPFFGYRRHGGDRDTPPGATVFTDGEKALGLSRKDQEAEKLSALLAQGDPKGRAAARLLEIFTPGMEHQADRLSRNDPTRRDDFLAQARSHLEDEIGRFARGEKVWDRRFSFWTPFITAAKCGFKHYLWRQDVQRQQEGPPPVSLDAPVKMGSDGYPVSLYDLVPGDTPDMESALLWRKFVPLVATTLQQAVDRLENPLWRQIVSLRLADQGLSEILRQLQAGGATLTTTERVRQLERKAWQKAARQASRQLSEQLGRRVDLWQLAEGVCTKGTAPPNVFIRLLQMAQAAQTP